MPSKRTKSVRVVNPRALSVNVEPKQIPNVLPPDDRIVPKATPRSRRLVGGPNVKIIGKVPNPYVSDAPEEM